MKEDKQLLLELSGAAASSAAGDFRTDKVITTEEERKRLRRAALIKMLAMFAFVFCVIVFSSMQATTIQMTV